tara:strand:- start:4520 stop:5497 length:978 start_codon:yes stop_codon:yes gene_type:complete
MKDEDFEEWENLWKSGNPEGFKSHLDSAPNDLSELLSDAPPSKSKIRTRIESVAQKARSLYDTSIEKVQNAIDTFEFNVDLIKEKGLTNYSADIFAEMWNSNFRQHYISFQSARTAFNTSVSAVGVTVMVGTALALVYTWGTLFDNNPHFREAQRQMGRSFYAFTANSEDQIGDDQPNRDINHVLVVTPIDIDTPLASPTVSKKKSLPFEGYQIQEVSQYGLFIGFNDGKSLYYLSMLDFTEKGKGMYRHIVDNGFPDPVTQEVTDAVSHLNHRLFGYKDPQLGKPLIVPVKIPDGFELTVSGDVSPNQLLTKVHMHYGKVNAKF